MTDLTPIQKEIVTALKQMKEKSLITEANLGGAIGNPHAYARPGGPRSGSDRREEWSVSATRNGGDWGGAGSS